MIRALIFDCFGVLVGQGFDETYRTAGGDPFQDRDFIQSLLGRSNLGLITQTGFLQEITRKLNISDHQWSAALRQAELPNNELLQYIESLRPAYKTAILSNANRGVVQSKLGQDCLKKCFDTVIESAEVGKTKPDRAIYEYAAQKLDVKPSECVFIDDLEGYVQAAEHAGMQGIWYQNLAQTKTELNALLG